MKQFFAALLALLSCQLYGQDFRLTGNLKYGKFNIGFLDTVAFHPVKSYSYQHDSGAKPYFIHIWFPTLEKGERVSVNQFLQFRTQTALNDTIGKLMEHSLLQYGILTDLDTWNNIEHSEAQQRLSEEILAATTNAMHNVAPVRKRFPTIIYHHGNGGVPWENWLLFEYLASHGYVVVSSYYHWPGLRTRAYHQHNRWPLDDVDFVAGLAAALPFVDAENLHYVGHSWGASLGLQMNHRDSVHFKQYLLFDSTIEHFGLEENAAIAPTLDSLLRNDPGRFNTKTIDITSRRRYVENGKEIISVPEFQPFQYLNGANIKLATLTDILNHGSFTSLGVARGFFVDKHEQVDAQTMESQLKTYHDLLAITKSILDGDDLENNQKMTIRKE